jgi:error-prone DNA polymerase
LKPAYIELHTRSAFSFLRGGSAPEQLAERAAELELPALALCDRMGVYGAPRFFAAAREQGLRAIVGAELVLEDESVLPVLVQSRTGYRHLGQLLTNAHLRSPKGKGFVRWDELPQFAPGLTALTGDEEGPLQRALLGEEAPQNADTVLRRLQEAFGTDNVFVEVQRHLRRGENQVHSQLIALARAHRLPLLAANGVLYATPTGRQVLDVFTCLRHHTHLDAAGKLLSANAERHLKPGWEMSALFGDVPEAITNTARLAERLEFTLADLGYEFPKYPVGAGESMESVLRGQTLAGAQQRYAGQIPGRVQALLEKELALINKLGFAGYFLIVADLVRFCREQDIMVQGRGSAANSAVCYCLGITAVDPVKFNVLFERFLSEGRKGWPDIDLDLPSGDRRERVIQEVYQRYGRHGAAMTATVISYRGRSAAREIGKVLQLPLDVIERICGLIGHFEYPQPLDLLETIEQAGLPKAHPRARSFISLYLQLARLPRHLGQHTGGMIICQGALSSIVPLENASMPGRVVAQWDKDDCEDLGIIKVDLLGLGMMSVLQDALTLTRQRGCPVDIAHLPENDPATYQLLQRADTVGVFQVESRAQMATLPRLRPECFYDLVIEVAIIRPGPIQGDLAHPFLRRRTHEEDITYYDERLIPILERTLGVPLFQEQVLQIAMVMADFTGSEAEELRRALSFHRSEEKMERVLVKLRTAMEQKQVSPEAAERIAKAVGSFALYGFPESHAISFALLAYASAYLKRRRAPEFFTALFNNQPMGFYAPATLVRDAKRHGVQIRPVCVARSNWECGIEPDNSIRLGLLQVQGLHHQAALAMLQERARQPFASMEDFQGRTHFSKAELRTLAEIGALNCLAPHRRAALWEVERPYRDHDLVTPVEPLHDQPAPLRLMDFAERLRADYLGLQLTTGPHPMTLVRPQLERVWRAADLKRVRNGQWVRVAGQVICRQRPGTAKGVCFISLEDETGVANLIVSPQLFEKERLKITTEPFLLVTGVAQHRHNTTHIKVRAMERLVLQALDTGLSSERLFAAM